MPIIIQDLLASDTLSQAVDKINFNFDQLLLNGGGPSGPIGPAGPTGPAGGRGIRGSVWYEDVSPFPGTSPNDLFILGLNEDDNFLQSNGQVWSYNGTTWVQTVINLTGPTGAAGQAAGFNYIGGFPLGNVEFGRQNVAFPIPMPNPISGGATQFNQGVSTMLLGAVGSNEIAPPGITYTSAFQLPDAIAAQLDSSIVSTLIHQKDSNASSIVFMGGGDVPSDNYEQSSLANLSNIVLGNDDQLIINIPKPATSPGSMVDLLGFTINTLSKGQQYRAGKQINFISGADGNPSGFGGERSDVSFIINSSNPNEPAKLSVSTTLASSNALFELGGDVQLTTSTSRTGRSLIDTGEIRLTGATNIKLNLASANFIDLNASRISLNHPTRLRIGTTTGSPNDAIIEVGTPQGMPNDTTKPGAIKLEGGNLRLISRDVITLIRNNQQFIQITNSENLIKHTNLITIESSLVGSGGVGGGTSPGGGFTTINNAIIQLGDTGTIPLNTSKAGSIRIEGGFTSIVGNTVRISRDNTNRLTIGSNGIRLLSNEEIEIDSQTVTLEKEPQTNENNNAQMLVRNPSSGRVEKLPGLPTIPVGGIIMWSGSINNIPTGWALCNGQNANNIPTPDLRGRFIVGVDPGQSQQHSPTNAGTIGATGGQKEVRLSITQMPPHFHYLAANAQASDPGITGTSTIACFSNFGACCRYIFARPPSGCSATLGQSSTAGGGPGGTTTLGAPHDNLPPYYVMAYIMYVGVA